MRIPCGLPSSEGEPCEAEVSGSSPAKVRQEGRTGRRPLYLEDRGPLVESETPGVSV